MKPRLTFLSVIFAIAFGLFLSNAKAQSVLFDLDNAPLHSPLPIDLTVGGIIAHFSANPTYYNYSIQTADALGFTPAGFSGYCIYPSTIYPCDLLISFDHALTNISIMYAPEEYATDSSCTMRLTAYLGLTPVGTTTFSIDPPGTWPTGTLAFSSLQPFDNVVIHYDAPPVTGGDYGPIFMVDNLSVTIAPTCTPVAAGLVSWWPGDGNPADIIGGNDGTLMNGATYAPGMVGQAFSFDGVNDYINLPNVVNGWAEGTVEAWISFNDPTPSDSGNYLFSAGNGTILGIHKAAGNDLRFGIYDAGWQWAGSGVVPNAGQWYHVAATWGPAGIKIYIDGVLSGTNPYTGPSYNSSFNMLGASSVTGSTVNAFIDEFGVFNRALDITEIQAIHDAASAGRCKPEICLANISTRASVGTGDSVAIGGFIIQSDPNPAPIRRNGSRPAVNAVNTKRVLIRGIGPSLQAKGTPLSGCLLDPVLQLYNGNGNLIATNDDWRVSDGIQTETDIINTGLAPSDDHESALLRDLASDNAYTAILRGKDPKTGEPVAGIGLVEIYDVELLTNTHLANISTRGLVSVGDDVLIGGVIVRGGQPEQFVFRAIGPSLANSGISGFLADPQLDLHDGQGTIVAHNDNWKEENGAPDAAREAAINATGLAPTNDSEAAILLTPSPGNYTAVMSGVGGTIGIGLVEAYDLGAPAP